MTSLNKQKQLETSKVRKKTTKLQAKKKKAT